MGLSINYSLIYMGRGAYGSHSVYEEVRGQISALSSLTPYGLSQELNSVFRLDKWRPGPALLEPALPLSITRALFSGEGNGRVLTSASVVMHDSQRPLLYISCPKMCLSKNWFWNCAPVCCLPVHLEVTTWSLPSPSGTGHSKHFCLCQLSSQVIA